ncbi:MAG: sugar kinase [Planctomycetes bacterium]|nr:sugar kinase [Planctomycetota bacterium]
MKSIWSIGEPLVEIMRPDVDMPLGEPGVFRGPFPSGAPAIFIDAVAQLGRECGFFATVGNDAFGALIINRLKRDGVNCEHIRISGDLSTGVAFVAYDSAGERVFIYHIGNAAAGQIELPKQLPANVGIFHVMGSSILPSKAMAQSIVTAVKHYHEAGTEITFDPNLRIESLRGQNLQEVLYPVLERTSIFMPGVSELLAITEEKTVEKAAEKLFANPVLKIIALKRGSKGCSVITRDESFDMPIFPVVVADATGAGDYFDAGFLCAYLDGKPLRECARLASAVAAINTAAFGPMEGVLSKENIANIMAGS